MSPLMSLLSTQFTKIEVLEVLSTVWSGCGQIVRCKLDGQICVVKLIDMPMHISHPRITQTEFAINRKRHSYLVEYNWYKIYSQNSCPMALSIPCVKVIKHQQQYAMVFKDFLSLGYRQAVTSEVDSYVILKWLAHFHAYHLNNNAESLWGQGSYWHLATRPDELKNITDSQLAKLAPKLDRQLTQCHFQTLIHGDAKVANFAIDAKQAKAFAYDFQYIGKGVGIVDVMYFLGSVCDEATLIEQADRYLEYYFSILTLALETYQPSINPHEVVASWRGLWSYAWADFYRFLAGWSPEHFKINNYMKKHYHSIIKDTYE